MKGHVVLECRAKRVKERAEEGEMGQMGGEAKQGN